MGHVVRSLALGQEWARQGGRVTFVTTCETPSFAVQLADEQWERVVVPRPYPAVEDWRLTDRAAMPDAVIVLDGYHFDRAYQRAVIRSGRRLLVIDDAADRDGYEAHVLLNQNIHASLLAYPTDAPACRLLGPEFALIRAEFPRDQQVVRQWPATATRLLVTLGGTDRGNNTSRVLAGLSATRTALEITVVLGPANAYGAAVDEIVSTSPHPVTVHRDSHDMPALMAAADLAISAAGSTCWELAMMGVPALLVVVAENQRLLAVELERRGAAASLGWHTDLASHNVALVVDEWSANRSRRMCMSQAAMSLVDGRGAERVVAALAVA